MALIAGSYPCFSGSCGLYEDEVSVGEAECAGHKLPHLMVLSQQHSLHLTHTQRSLEASKQ